MDSKKCEQCDNEFMPSWSTPYQRFCSVHCRQKAYYNKRGRGKDKSRYAVLRNKLLNILGEKCVACGCKDIYVLTFDHIFNDRKGKTNNRDSFYRWVKNIDWFKEYIQVLCFNCNHLKDKHPEIFNKRYTHLVARPKIKDLIPYILR